MDGHGGDPPLATLTRRRIASVLDGLGAALLTSPFVAVLVVVLAGQDSLEAVREAAAAEPLLGVTVPALGALAVQVGWYVWWPVRTGGQTPAKRLLHVRVVTDDGRPLGWGAAAVRHLVFAALGVVSAVFALFDERRRCLHDRAAGTVVVSAR